MINTASKLLYLIIKKHLFFCMNQKIELYLCTINVTVQIHYNIFCTTTIHAMNDMKNSYHIFIALFETRSFSTNI